jgi:predicted RNA-binding protein with RPS1 domain
MYKHAARFLRRHRERGLALRENKRGTTRGNATVPTHLRKAFRAGTFVTGEFRKRVRSGCLVVLGGYEAFCPASEMYPRLHSEDDRAATLPGGQLEFAILRIDTRGVVVSRRRVARSRAWRNAHAALRTGRPIDGTVERVMAYGAFIDLGGVTGLLHISQALVNSAGDLSAYCVAGDQLQVLVLSVDSARERLSLSLRTPLDAGPWGKSSRQFGELSWAGAGGSDGRSASLADSEPSFYRNSPPPPSISTKWPTNLGDAFRKSQRRGKKDGEVKGVADANAAPHRVKRRPWTRICRECGCETRYSESRCVCGRIFGVRATETLGVLGR